MAERKFVPCGPGQSFFRLIDAITGTDAFSGQPRSTLHRICTLMRKMEAQTVVVEAVDSDTQESDRVSEELQSIETRLGRNVIHEPVWKLTFVRSEVSDGGVLSEVADHDFLGYAILINLQLAQDMRRPYVYESIIREPGRLQLAGRDSWEWQPLLNNYMHVGRSFGCSVGSGMEYSLEGSYFCQQNGITSVCAHACAAMVVNNCMQTEQIVTCQDVNRLLNIDHRIRMLHTDWGCNDRAAQKGLSIMELELVFRSFGLTPYTVEFSDPVRYFREFLYGFVESACPAVLAFTTTDVEGHVWEHVVPVFGHTLNSDSWFPGAFANYAIGFVDRRYLSTLDWVADFIVHDDNYGMYFCLPGHAFRPEGRQDRGMRFMPFAGIGVYRAEAGVRLLGYQAELLAVGALGQVLEGFARDKNVPFPSYYLFHLLPRVLEGLAVSRSTLVRCEQNLDHLQERDNRGCSLSEDERSALAHRLADLSHVWLVEVTEQDLYIGNKAKVIDVLVDPRIEYDEEKAQTDGPYGVVLIRFPGFAMAPVLPAPRPPEYLVAAQLSVEGHLPLFTFGGRRAASTVW